MSCRQHGQQIIVTAEDDPDEQQQEAAGRWDAFWGYDLVRSHGMLEKIFSKLQIKESSWASLKEIPEVCNSSPYLYLEHHQKTAQGRDLSLQAANTYNTGLHVLLIP